MLKRLPGLVVFFVLIGAHRPLSAQITASDQWISIYNDGRFRVELALIAPKSGNCRFGQNKYRFKYRKKGHSLKKTYLVWQIDFEGCDNNVYTKQVSFPIRFGEQHSDWLEIETLDASFSFNAKALLTQPYNFRTSSVAIESEKRLSAPKSTAPLAIEGEGTVRFGESTRLSVSGGSLKPGSEWVWYEGRCGGTEIGRGPSVYFSPGQKTIVFVRAEGKSDKTDCISRIIEVDRRSMAAEQIVGSSHICSGEASKLMVRGGFLGLDAEWVWYEASCGLTRIGTGEALWVSPSEKTSYFVRAEGRYNTTDCVEFMVEVSDPVLKPEGILANKTLVCEGEQVELWVKNFPGNTAGNWHWSADYCGGKTLGTGSKFVTRLTETTTFFVRGVSACNETSCLSVTVEVIPKMYDPGVIRYKDPAYLGEEITLTVIPNPLLGRDTRFIWFKNSCERNAVGTGKSIVVKARNQATYFVKAVTECNESNCEAIRIFPEKRPGGMVPARRFFVLGYGFGFATKSFYGIAEQQDINGNTSPQELLLSNMGLRADLSFHPVFTDFFGFGINGGVEAGTSPGVFFKSTGTVRFTYAYRDRHIGGELFLGLRTLKLLVKQDIALQDNTYTRTEAFNGPVGTLTYNADYYRQSFGMGLRLGRSIGKFKRAISVDLLYLLELQGTASFRFFRNPLETDAASGWHGFSMGFRSKNANKAFIKVLFPGPMEAFGKFDGKPIVSVSWNFLNT